MTPLQTTPAHTAPAHTTPAQSSQAQTSPGALDGWAGLMLLADARLPAGGHAHSSGMEQAVDEGVVVGVDDLDCWLRRRLDTTARTAAGLAAAACLADGPGLTGLDAEADARTVSPAARAASRAMGRSLLRLAREVWPAEGPRWDCLGARPHHPLVLGVAASAAGLNPEGAALLAAYLSLTGPASAAQRLLGLDPAAVTRLLAALSPALQRVAAGAAGAAYRGDAYALPADADLLLDLLAERHATRKERLFVS